MSVGRRSASAADAELRIRIGDLHIGRHSTSADPPLVLRPGPIGHFRDAPPNRGRYRWSYGGGEGDWEQEEQQESTAESETELKQLAVGVDDEGYDAGSDADTARDEWEAGPSPVGLPPLLWWPEQCQEAVGGGGGEVHESKKEDGDDPAKEVDLLAFGVECSDEEDEKDLITFE